MFNFHATFAEPPAPVFVTTGSIVYVYATAEEFTSFGVPLACAVALIYPLLFIAIVL